MSSLDHLTERGLLSLADAGSVSEILAALRLTPEQQDGLYGTDPVWPTELPNGWLDRVVIAPAGNGFKVTHQLSAPDDGEIKSGWDVRVKELHKGWLAHLKKAFANKPTRVGSLYTFEGPEGKVALSRARLNGRKWHIVVTEVWCGQHA